MSKGAGETGGLIRPQLPCEFAVPGGRIAQVVAFCVVLFAVGGLLLYGAAADDSAPGAPRVLGVAFGFGLMSLGMFVAQRTLRSVTIDDEGLRLRLLFRSRTVRWEDVAQVRLGCESKARKQSRASMAAGGGLVGGAIGSLVAGSAVDEAGTHREGDPFEHGQLRRYYAPNASLAGSDGKNLARFDEAPGWAFFTALRAEALARGVTVRRSTQSPKSPGNSARRRR